MRILASGCVLPFDAGYWECKVSVPPDSIAPRHPAATAAVLDTGVKTVPFGGITGGPRSTSGTSGMSANDLGTLYKHRTALGARQIKSLPDTTDAPEGLSKIPQEPSNDDVAMRANMPKVPTKPRKTPRTRTICFDLQGPFAASKHAGNRYCVNWCVPDTATQKDRWIPDCMPSKDCFPAALEDFLDSGDYRGYQMYTDNEHVLNSDKVKEILKRRKMPPMRNSCEYEPWQNPAERPWRTFSAGSREFLLRGFGRAHDGDEPCDTSEYWTYSHNQVADVYNATRALGTLDKHNRITHLRVPFCLAYSRTPVRYRAGKLAPQAERCMHLGYSRTKPGYVLEVLEGPRKGRVITSSQVKFRENVFPMHKERPSNPPECVPHNDSDDALLWYDIPDDDDLAPTVHHNANDDSDSDDDDDDDYVASLVDPAADPNEADSDDDDDDSGHPAVAAHGAALQRPTRSNTDVGDWRAVYNALDNARRTGAAVNVTKTRPGPGDSKWAPRHFTRIKDIDDVEERNAWYRSHYGENDGLVEKPHCTHAAPRTLESPSLHGSLPASDRHG